MSLNVVIPIKWPKVFGWIGGPEYTKLDWGKSESLKVTFDVRNKRVICLGRVINRHFEYFIPWMGTAEEQINKVLYEAQNFFLKAYKLSDRKRAI